MKTLFSLLFATVTIAGQTMGTLMNNEDQFPSEWLEVGRYQLDSQRLIVGGFLYDCYGNKNANNFYKVVRDQPLLAIQNQMECFRLLAKNYESDPKLLNAMVQSLLSLKDVYSHEESSYILSLFKAKLLRGGQNNHELVAIMAKSKLHQGAANSLTLRASVQHGFTDIFQYLVDNRRLEVNFEALNNEPVKTAFINKQWKILEILIPYVDSMKLLDLLTPEKWRKSEKLNLNWNNKTVKQALGYSFCRFIQQNECESFAEFAADTSLIFPRSLNSSKNSFIRKWLDQTLFEYFQAQNYLKNLTN